MGEYLVNACVTQLSFVGPVLFILYINELSDEIICNTATYMLMILHATQSVISHLICGNNYSWILNLNLSYVRL